MLQAPFKAWSKRTFAAQWNTMDTQDAISWMSLSLMPRFSSVTSPLTMRSFFNRSGVFSRILSKTCGGSIYLITHKPVKASRSDKRDRFVSWHCNAVAAAAAALWLPLRKCVDQRPVFSVFFNATFGLCDHMPRHLSMQMRSILWRNDCYHGKITLDLEGVVNGLRKKWSDRLTIWLTYSSNRCWGSTPFLVRTRM